MGGEAPGARLGYPLPMHDTSTHPRWRPWAVALGICLVFHLVQLAWAQACSHPPLWGDSFHNAQDAYQAGRFLLFPPDPRGAAGIPSQIGPGLLISGGLWFHAVGMNHATLLAHQLILAELTALFLFATVFRLTHVAWVGWVGMLLFLAAPETLNMSHGFLLGSMGALFASISLLGFTLVQDRKRGGVGVLALGVAGALLSRQVLGLILLAPLLVCCTWPILRAAFGRPRTVVPILVVPMALGAALGRAPIRVDRAWTFGWFGFAFLCLALAALWGWKRHQHRGESLAGALGFAGGAVLPWGIASMQGIWQHYGDGTQIQHLGGDLPVWMAFEGLILAVRTLGPWSAALAIAGVIASLHPRTHPTLRLCALSVLATMLGARLFVHARYLYPLAPMGFVLAFGWWGRNLVSRVAATALGLLATLNLTGWALPVDVPALKPHEVFSEYIHMRPNASNHHGQGTSMADVIRPGLWPQTLRPVVFSPNAKEVVDAMVQACTQPPCKAHYPRPPAAVGPRSVDLEISNINHMILFGQAKLIFDDQPSPGLVFVVHDGEEGLQEWTREKLRSDHVSKWTVVETLDPFGDIQASVIQIEENRSRRR